MTSNLQTSCIHFLSTEINRQVPTHRMKLQCFKKKYHLAFIWTDHWSIGNKETVERYGSVFVHMYMHILYVCICMYICICMYMDILDMCIYALCVYVVYLCMYSVYMYVCTCVYAYMCVCIYVCVGMFEEWKLLGVLLWGKPHQRKILQACIWK